VTITHNFCSHLSRTASEQLFGTGPDAKTIWLLLEYNALWGAKVFPESTLSAPVKAHLSAFLDNTPSSNILFIRQPGRVSDEIAFYVIVATEENPHLYRFQLNDYDDLLELDFAAVAGGAVTEPVYDEQLYLVCTNSKRDACCAKYGIGIYNELRQHVGNSAWQCSHIGGHRFAPTALFFPQGICYGRMNPNEAKSFVSLFREGQIALDYLRGRACYDRPTQAADALLRLEHNLTHVDDVQFINSETMGANEWSMQFRTKGENKNIRLEKVTTDVEIYTSCFDDKTAFLEEYRLV
jgi:hypothetical protein